jgi:hypothetical protein
MAAVAVVVHSGNNLGFRPVSQADPVDDVELPQLHRNLALPARWDTAVVEHPGGGLVVTLSSNQGATDMLFARPEDGVPATMRLLRHAIILDVDGSEAPTVSGDGRYIAVRGNAYVQSLDVFEFPTLRKVLHDPRPALPRLPVSPEWLAEQARWSRHNIAFAPDSAVPLVGTSRGSIVEIDLEAGRASEHDLACAPVKGPSP